MPNENLLHFFEPTSATVWSYGARLVTDNGSYGRVFVRSIIEAEGSPFEQADQLAARVERTIRRIFKEQGADGLLASRVWALGEELP